MGLPGRWIGTPSPGVINWGLLSLLNLGGPAWHLLLGFVGEDLSPWLWSEELEGRTRSWGWSSALSGTSFSPGVRGSIHLELYGWQSLTRSDLSGIYYLQKPGQGQY